MIPIKLVGEGSMLISQDDALLLFAALDARDAHLRMVKRQRAPDPEIGPEYRRVFANGTKAIDAEIERCQSIRMSIMRSLYGEPAPKQLSLGGVS